MTTDELIKLMEALVGHLSVRDLRQGGDVASVSLLDDEDYATLVKFLAGERPVAGLPPMPTVTELDELPKTVVENGKTRRLTSAERWAAAPPEREDPDKPLVLGGDFDGVQLP